MSTDFQLMEKKQTQCFCLSFHTYEFSTCILNWNKLLSNYSQSLSHVQLFATPWTAACQASLSITNSWCLLKLMSIKSVMNSPGKNTGLTFPPPGDLSNTGIKPRFPALQVDSLPAEPPGKTNSRQVRAISSVQFSHSVMSDSLQPQESQHARLPCPSPTPEAHSDSRPSSQWYHPAISSSVVPFSSCPQPLPASESFPVSQLFAWGGQSIGVSASASILPMNTQDWSPFGWTGWISLQSKGLSRIFSSTTVQKHQFFGAQPSSQSNSHIHTWPQEKP